MKVRCPRCATTTPVEPGRMPVCPSCGFAGDARYAPVKDDAGPSVDVGVAPLAPAEAANLEAELADFEVVPEEPQEQLITRQAEPPLDATPGSPRKRSVGAIIFFVFVLILLLVAVGIAYGYQSGRITYELPIP